MLAEDYQPLTTFQMDFTIADHFGIKAIKDTYKSALLYAKTNYKYFTELVVVLNHKIWQHWEQHHDAYAKLYDTLWKEAREEFYNDFEDNDQACRYYFEITD